MTRKTGDSLSPKDKPRKGSKEPALTRRILFLLLLAAGILALGIGTLQGGWQRIHHLSTSI